jgi:hypothetical protein
MTTITFAQAVENSAVVATTANGMVTYDTSADPVVDLFFAIGASRGKDITTAFERAYQHDALSAMQVLFWARDIRQGAGEREIFRQVLRWLEKNHPASVEANLACIPEYGRWDDLLIFSTARMQLLAADMIIRALKQGNALAAKWMPRQGAIANRLRGYINYSPKAWRKMLVELTTVVETPMCARQWQEINYNHVPSVAAARYQKAFNRQDPLRYAEWKQSLQTGQGHVNAQAVYPYDVIRSVTRGDPQVALAQWQALPNYLGDNSILPMVDVSGSMSAAVGGQQGTGLTCMQVAISLGLYIADKQQGAFRDMWLTFTRDSHIDILKGDLLAKLQQMRDNMGYNTNLESAFRSILQVAIVNQLAADQMPRYLLVLSDMEFDSGLAHGVSVSAWDLARSMFKQAGYELPRLVWWNLNARPNATGNSPVRFDQQGSALVSGFSPSIMTSILAAETFTPQAIMKQTIKSDRYQVIQA